MTNGWFYLLAALSSFLVGLLFVLSSFGFINIFQMVGYDSKKLVEWFVNNNNGATKNIIKNTAILFALITPFCALVLVVKLSEKFYILSGLIFIVFAFLTWQKNKSVVYKKPLVVTNRIKRLLVTFVLVNSLLVFLVYVLVTSTHFGFLILLICLVYMLQGLVLIAANAVVSPIEKSVNYHYILKAKNVIKQNKNLTIIGITGSYGKTSVKFILTQILKEKYFANCTPNSYNTLLGITKSVLSSLKPHHEMFVVEMGADHVNDIRKICKHIKPKIAILTSIGNQHLKTFKTQQNIIKTKYQIVENVESDGFSVFNVSNGFVKDLYDKTSTKKIGVSVNDKNADIFASNIKMSVEGLEFFVNYKTKRFKVKTKLLGEHNVINLLLCIAVALELGVEVSGIKKAVAQLSPTKSRLELVKLSNGAYILDDSFNSNPKGCDSAINVLKHFEDKIKIVLTPGMVELGVEQEQENYAFGAKLARVANVVYVVNKTNKDTIINGLIDNGFSKNNIKYFDNFILAFNDVKQILTNNHILLIENDLPDNYD